MKEKKCLALFSGGLDSLLAVKVMQKAGIEVKIINFDTGFFFGAYSEENGRRKFNANVPPDYDIDVVDISASFFEMIKDPKHGFGKNMNPCIDCKIFMLKKAKELLPVYDAGFVITGEVLGQRPMTQNSRAMKIIKDESGLGGYLVRPLCGKMLETTEPEKLGWIKKEDLLDIEGRTRKRQLDLAQEWGLTPYVKAPAGGCILTDKNYSKRLNDFLTSNQQPAISNDDVYLLTIGRQFRKDGIKFIIGRDKAENEVLEKFKDKGIYFDCKDVMGPVGLSIGVPDAAMTVFIASAVAAYSDGNKAEEVIITATKSGKQEELKVKPMDTAVVQEFRIDK